MVKRAACAPMCQTFIKHLGNMLYKKDSAWGNQFKIGAVQSLRGAAWKAGGFFSVA